MNRIIFYILIFFTVFALLLLVCCKKDKEDDPVLLEFGYDIDGNYYDTVRIGDQLWMAKNLMTTKYNNGGSITNPTNHGEWDNYEIGAYCWYNDDVNNKYYGALYNWYAVSTGKLCPLGWRVPTTNDWDKLRDFIDTDANGDDNVAACDLKSTVTEPEPHPRWDSVNVCATNQTGFNALPAGYKFVYTFEDLGEFAFWWATNEYSDERAFAVSIRNDRLSLVKSNFNKCMGFSVRCIKD